MRSGCIVFLLVLGGSTCSSFELNPLQRFDAVVQKRLQDVSSNQRSSSDHSVLLQINRSSLQSHPKDQLSLFHDSFESLRRSGGCCIVHLDVPNEKNLLDLLWERMDDDIFTTNLDFYHQILARPSSSTNSSEETSGYRFLQLSSSSPLWNEAGLDAYRDIFPLLERVSKQVIAQLLSEALDIPAQDTAHWIEQLCDEPNDDRSGTFLRLCEYLPVDGEALRPHCDWSLATVVPVSSIPGLEIYSEGRWVQPEAGLPARSAVVVMAGKWTEVLSRGRLPACIHRVVSGGNSQRKSTPFFLRPRAAVAEGVARYDTDDESPLEAIRAAVVANTPIN